MIFVIDVPTYIIPDNNSFKVSLSLFHQHQKLIIFNGQIYNKSTNVFVTIIFKVI